MHDSDDLIRASHNRVLEDWWELYGWGLSVAVTDTYGSEFFFSDIEPDQARKWKGFATIPATRSFGEKAIRFYQEHGSTRRKALIFSDGLELRRSSPSPSASGRIKLSFGWGTNLTNDLGFEPISIVVKAVEANGHRTVKLSDNLAKATGSREDIERFKRIFGHSHGAGKRSATDATSQESAW
jgi:nicotinate phosphoribosyltransferase